MGHGQFIEDDVGLSLRAILISFPAERRSFGEERNVWLVLFAGARVVCALCVGVRDRNFPPSLAAWKKRLSGVGETLLPKEEEGELRK